MTIQIIGVGCGQIEQGGRWGSVEGSPGGPKAQRPYDGEFRELTPEERTPPPNAHRAAPHGLSPAAIDAILRRHRLVQPQETTMPPPSGYLPVYKYGYAPSNGRQVGTTLDVTVSENRRTLVMMRSDFLPTVEQLSAVTVDPDGTVRQPWEAK